MKNVLRGFVAVLIAVLLSACVSAPGLVPSNERNWEDVHARISAVRWLSASRFSISNVRDWTWGADGPTRKNWHTRQFDLGETQAIWYFVEPLSFAKSMAHTFATFEIGRGDRRQFLTVSVEARREAGETYSPLRGLSNAYELIFAWSTEKDILVDTVMRLGHPLQAYRINVTPQQAGIILRGFLERTNELAQKPEFYNTLEHNCTSELAAVVNSKFDTPIPPHSSFVLTGNAARYLHSLGFIGDPATPFAEIEKAADAREAVRKNAHLPERQFSVAFRRSLGHR
ncbi:MAG TPA: DUF4105 domain-containing protein [Rhizobiales bacterium]|nr:DUF4105 domain-containing protein [Hyphomicrobiales bacterium]